MKRSPKNKNHSFIYIAFGLAFLSLAVFFGVSRFNITTVEVAGTEFIDPDSIKKTVLKKTDDGFFSSNVLLFSKKRFKEAIQKDFVIESMDIKRRLPHSLRVIVKEFAPAAFWATAGVKFEPIEEAEGEIKPLNDASLQPTKLFFIDSRGIILHEWQKPVIEEAEEEPIDPPLIEQPGLLAEKKFKNMPIIIDVDGIASEPGVKALADSYGSYIERFEKNFSKDEFPFSIEYFSYPGALAPKEMRVMTDKGFWVILNLNADWQKISKNLKETIAENKIADFEKLSYIDLRLEDRIFYK